MAALYRGNVDALPQQAMLFFGEMDLGACRWQKAGWACSPLVKAREEIREMFEKPRRPEHIEAKVECHSEAEARDEKTRL